MSDFRGLVDRLLLAGVEPGEAADIVHAAFMLGAQSSVTNDSAAERRRAWDRERKERKRAAKSTGIPPVSTGIPPVSTGIPPEKVETPPVPPLPPSDQPALLLDSENHQPLTPPLSPPAARATKRCPVAFEPDRTVYRVAEENGLSDADMRREIEMMRDHQFRDAHKDWQAVARNWLRKAQPRKNGAAQNLSFAAQDILIEAEGTRRFNELMEARYGQNDSGHDQISSRGVVIALPSKEAGTGR